MTRKTDPTSSEPKDDCEGRGRSGRESASEAKPPRRMTTESSSGHTPAVPTPRNQDKRKRERTLFHLQPHLRNQRSTTSQTTVAAHQTMPAPPRIVSAADRVLRSSGTLGPTRCVEGQLVSVGRKRRGEEAMRAIEKGANGRRRLEEGGLSERRKQKVISKVVGTEKDIIRLKREIIILQEKDGVENGRHDAATLRNEATLANFEGALEGWQTYMINQSILLEHVEKELLVAGRLRQFTKGELTMVRKAIGTRYEEPAPPAIIRIKTPRPTPQDVLDQARIDEEEEARLYDNENVEVVQLGPATEDDDDVHEFIIDEPYSPSRPYFDNLGWNIGDSPDYFGPPAPPTSPAARLSTPPPGPSGITIPSHSFLTPLDLGTPYQHPSLYPPTFHLGDPFAKGADSRDKLCDHEAGTVETIGKGSEDDFVLVNERRETIDEGRWIVVGDE